MLFISSDFLKSEVMEL